MRVREARSAGADESVRSPDARRRRRASGVGPGLRIAGEQRRAPGEGPIRDLSLGVTEGTTYGNLTDQRPRRMKRHPQDQLRKDGFITRHPRFLVLESVSTSHVGSFFLSTSGRPGEWALKISFNSNMAGPYISTLEKAPDDARPEINGRAIISIRVHYILLRDPWSDPYACIDLRPEHSQA